MKLFKKHKQEDVYDEYTKKLIEIFKIRCNFLQQTKKQFVDADTADDIFLKEVQLNIGYEILRDVLLVFYIKDYKSGAKRYISEKDYYAFKHLKEETILILECGNIEIQNEEISKEYEEAIKQTIK